MSPAFLFTSEIRISADTIGMVTTGVHHSGGAAIREITWASVMIVACTGAATAGSPPRRRDPRTTAGMSSLIRTVTVMISTMIIMAIRVGIISIRAGTMIIKGTGNPSLQMANVTNFTLISQAGAKALAFFLFIF